MSILQITSSDWHINQKVIPPPDSEEYDAYYEYQRELCLNGCTIDGVFINPYLYWHLNFWHVDVDYPNPNGGKPLQSYDHPLLRDNEWIIFDGIWQAEQQGKGLALLGSRRISKDLLNTSKLYTIDGEIEIGDAKVGQKIFDDQGELTTITGVYPQGIRPVYKMSLRDGRELYCGLDHNWSVIERASRKIPGTRRSVSYKREVVKTTKELIDSGIQNKRAHNGYKDGKTHHIKEAKYWIRNNKPVQYQTKKLPIDPYFLGLWLGEGHSSSPAITTEDREIADYIGKFADKLGLTVRVFKKVKKDGPENKAKTYSITSGGYGGVKLNKNPLKSKMRELDLIGNKHIPDVYLRSSVKQRLELLRGLMDSDGSCSEKGNISFSSSMPNLAKDFYFLVRSLGISTKKSIRKTHYLKGGKRFPCKDSHLFNLYTELPIFKLKRKLSKMSIGKKTCQPKIDKCAIIDIQYVFDAPTTCITVDNEQKLFLTDDFTITHNSSFLSSYLAHGGTFDEGSQNIVSGLNSPDIKLITDKLDKGLNHLPEAFSWMKIEAKWDRQVTLGVKDKTGNSYPFSTFLIRNLDNGNNQEAIAGTKPRKLVIDEAGKNKFLKGLQAAAPGFTTPYGWTCSPIILGTSGLMEGYQDIQKLFNGPKAFNFLEFPHESKPGKTHGLFLGAKYRMETKDPTTLGEYLNKPLSKELVKIPFLVSNEEKAFELTDEIIENLREAGDKEAYIKEQMYYPKTVEDLFLNTKRSLYNAKIIKSQIQRIEDLNLKGQAVELFYGEKGIEWKTTHKNIIDSFPLGEQNPDAAICIWEHPIPNPPRFLYVSGVDSYKFSKAGTDSLGAVYIYKRLHNISGEGFQDMFVASYVARPDEKEDWMENARMLIKYYNAYTLVENDEDSFIEFMKSKQEADIYLAPQPSFQKSLVRKTNLDRKFGLSRSSAAVRNHLNVIYKDYMDEIIDRTLAEDGSIISETRGVSRIFDRALLQVTAQYDGHINADQIVAVQLALALARELDPLMGAVEKEDPRMQAIFGKGKTKDNSKKAFQPARSKYRRSLFSQPRR